MAYISTSDIETYINQWLATATKGKVVAHFAFIVNRMTLKCNVCEMQLTAPKPESSDKIDYSVQEFVKIHAHTGGHCAHVWVEVPKTGSSQCQKCNAWLHGDAPPPTPVTLDFKKVNSATANGFGGEGIIQGYGTSTIDCKPSSAAVIQKQMDEYNKTMEVKSLELELKVKQIQLQAAKESLGLAQTGVLTLADKGLLTDPQKIALAEQLLKKQEELQAQIIEEQKAKQQALENALKLKLLQDKLQATKMEFHDTGHIPPELPPKPKPLKISTGRKFR